MNVQLRVLRPVYVQGKPLGRDRVLEVDEQLAVDLLNTGRVELVADTPAGRIRSSPVATWTKGTSKPPNERTGGFINNW